MSFIMPPQNKNPFYEKGKQVNKKSVFKSAQMTKLRLDI